MVTVLLTINGEDTKVDWERVEIDLFHQINRVIDLEGGRDEQVVYFSTSDWMDVKRWIVAAPVYINLYERIDSESISVILNGRYLHLKHNSK